MPHTHTHTHTHTHALSLSSYCLLYLLSPCEYFTLLLPLVRDAPGLRPHCVGRGCLGMQAPGAWCAMTRVWPLTPACRPLAGPCPPPACLPACLPVYPPACLPSCPACVFARLFFYSCACLPACLAGCLPACLSDFSICLFPPERYGQTWQETSTFTQLI